MNSSFRTFCINKQFLILKKHNLLDSFQSGLFKIYLIVLILCIEKN